MASTTPPPPALPLQQTAIVADGSGNLVISRAVPLPNLEPDMLLVQTHAVAINPADVKLTGSMAAEGATAGNDCAGVVVAVGADAQDRFAVGDRVCAATVPMDLLAPRAGAFAEYAAVTADFALKVPDGMPIHQAAALGIGVATIGYALYRSLRIPGHPDRPAEKPVLVFVYGGSTASGTMAIQLIRRSGCIPITTCSERSFGLVAEYGAEKAWDYHDDSVVAAIKAYTEDGLEYALDCVCDAGSMEFCYRVLGRAGGRYTTLEPYPDNLSIIQTRKRRVKPEWIMGPALLGKKIGWKPPYDTDPDPELRVFGKQWFLCAQQLLDRREIRPHPVRVGEKRGFGAVLDGVELLKAKAVSGQKLVYYVGDVEEIR